MDMPNEYYNQRRRMPTPDFYHSQMGGMGQPSGMNNMNQLNQMDTPMGGMGNSMMPPSGMPGMGLQSGMGSGPGMVGGQPRGRGGVTGGIPVGTGGNQISPFNPKGMLPPPSPSGSDHGSFDPGRPPAGGAQSPGGFWSHGSGKSGGNNSMNDSFPAQNSRSSAYRPNQRSNRFSTGGNMNANRMRAGYRGPRGYGGYGGSVSGRYQTPRGGMDSFDTGGLNANPYGGLGRRMSHPDFGPYRSPGMPSVNNRNTYNTRTYNTNRNYDNRRTYNTQTFNQGDTSIQGPRIAKKMDRMQGYNPMMHGSQSRQIGGLRNLQRMLMALRGGRR